MRNYIMTFLGILIAYSGINTMEYNSLHHIPDKPITYILIAVGLMIALYCTVKRVRDE